MESPVPADLHSWVIDPASGDICEVNSVDAENPELTSVEFTKEEIELVREAIRKAKETMQEWREASRVPWEKMHTPIRRL